MEGHYVDMVVGGKKICDHKDCYKPAVFSDRLWISDFCEEHEKMFERDPVLRVWTASGKVSVLTRPVEVTVSREELLEMYPPRKPCKSK